MDNFSAIGSHISHHQNGSHISGVKAEMDAHERAQFSRAPSAMDPLMNSAPIQNQIAAQSQPILIQNGIGPVNGPVMGGPVNGQVMGGPGSIVMAPNMAAVAPTPVPMMTGYPSQPLPPVPQV